MASFAGGNSPMSGTQVLARLAGVDGLGSGLDADAMRGLNPDGTVYGTKFGNIPAAGQYPNPPRFPNGQITLAFYS